ncbi:MAG: ABC transporter permease subunit [Streptosporangiales bacterium]|nr:ABC transporter permease subunit [Streptosporangiales bacterium]
MTDTSVAAPPERAEAAKPAATREKPPGRAGWFARSALLVLCVLWLIPTIGVLVSSFRAEDLVKTTGWWTALASPLDAAQWTLQNYGDVLLAEGMANSFINSLVVAIPATIIPILMAAFAAYAFAWMDFPGRYVFFVLIVGLLVVPLQVAFIPLLQLYGDLGISRANPFLGVWLAHAGFGMPLAVYILRNYMGSLSREIIESARVDGAGHMGIFWRLIIPLSTPALAAYAIFQFLWVWNDLLVALVFLGGGENSVLTYQLSQLVGTRKTEWHLLTSGAFLTMIVPLIVFFSLQRYFVRGLTAGAVKG